MSDLNVADALAVRFADGMNSGRTVFARLVSAIHDAEHGRSLVFWTNQFDLPALTIAELYRQRWQVELFFKWIKSNLPIHHFLGLSDNAVRIQLWSAICVYALVAIAKKRCRLSHSLHQILQVCSVAALERVQFQALFSRGAHRQR